MLLDFYMFCLLNKQNGQGQKGERKKKAPVLVPRESCAIIIEIFVKTRKKDQTCEDKKRPSKRKETKERPQIHKDEEQKSLLMLSGTAISSQAKFPCLPHTG
jgi:hypothetical protein